MPALSIRGSLGRVRPLTLSLSPRRGDVAGEPEAGSGVGYKLCDLV